MFYNSITISPDKVFTNSEFNITVNYDNLINLWLYKEIIRISPLVKVYSVNFNRFFEKVIDEILKYISIDNHVEFHFKDNQYLTWFGLKAVIEKLFPNEFTIVSQTKIEPNYWVISFARIEYLKEYYIAEHTGWTFGLLTLGDRQEGVRKFISSIEKYCNEPYEIIIVCPQKIDFLTEHKNVLLVKFSERDSLGWITKKKNMVCNYATYSDILVCHDRFLLTETFFEKFKTWGYSYGIAAPRVILSNGKRSLDWAMVSSQNYVWSSGGQLNYRTYSEFAYCPGGATLIRKSFWKKHKWNESIYWNEHEDVELCRRVQRYGDIIYLADSYLVTNSDRWLNVNYDIPHNQNTEIILGKAVGEQVRIYVDYQNNTNIAISIIRDFIVMILLIIKKIKILMNISKTENKN
jgi:hypothetical protein